MRLILIFLLLVCTACDPHHTSHAPLKVGTNQWPGYELLYLARTLNFSQPQDIKLVEMTSATDVLNAFSQGRLDIAALTLDEVLQLTEKHNDLRVFLVMDISNGADQLIASSTITELSELEGKTVAVEETALGAFFLSQIKQAANLNDDAVQHLPTTVDQHTYVMSEGLADAVITFEPSASQLINKGFHKLFDSSQIPGKIVDVLVTREATLVEHKEKVEALIQAHWRALNYFRHYPDKAHEKIAPRLHVEADQIAPMYQGLILPDQTLNKELLQHDLIDTGNELALILKKQSLISMQNSLDMQTLFTAEFIQ